ncbi:unnamed protein product [Umbelopsis sp. WA50703]
MVTVDGLLGFLATVIILLWVLSGSVYAILEPYLEDVDWPCLENFQYAITNSASSKLISFYVNSVSIRFKEGTVTLANPQRRTSTEASLKLVIALNSTRVIVHDLKNVEADVAAEGVYQGDSIVGSLMKSVLKHFWASPTFNRMISFFLRRMVVEFTNTSIVWDGVCTLIAPESSVTQSKVFLGADGGDIERDAGSEEHRKNLVMSKHFTQYKLKRAHSVNFDMGSLYLVKDGQEISDDSNFLCAFDPLIISASVTLPAHHGDKHLVALEGKIDQVDIKLKEILPLLDAVGKIDGKVESERSFEFLTYLETFHFGVDKVNIMNGFNIKGVADSLRVSAFISSAEDKKDLRISLATTEISLLWTEDQLKDVKFFCVEYIHLDVNQNRRIAELEDGGVDTKQPILSTHATIHLENPDVSVYYHLIKPLQSQIQDFHQAFWPGETKSSIRKVDASLSLGRIQTKLTMKNSAMSFHGSDGQFINQVYVTLSKLSMSQLPVKKLNYDINKNKPESKNSSRNEENDITLTTDSQLQGMKTKVCLEVQNLTTWNQACIGLQQCKYQPASTNYLSISHFGLKGSIGASTWSSDHPNSMHVTFGTVHIDIRNVYSLVETIKPWNTYFEIGAPVAEQDSKSSLPSFSHIQISLHKLILSFMVTDTKLSQNITIPPNHFCNAPKEDINSGMLFLLADLSIMLPIQRLPKFANETPIDDWLSSMSLSSKEVSLCSLIDTTGSNTIFDLNDEPLLWIPLVNAKLYQRPSAERYSNVRWSLVIDSPLLKFCMSPTALYTSLCLVKPILAAELALRRSTRAETAEGNQLHNTLKLKLSITELAGRFSLAPTMKHQVYSSDLNIDVQPQQRMVSAKKILLCGTADHGKQWKQLVHASQLKLTHSSSNGINVMLHTLHFRLPHGYVCATIVEAAIHAFKLTKTLYNRLVKSELVEWQGPNGKSGAVEVPTLKLRVQQFKFEVEDDPFESKLRLIWRTGINEQPRRLKTEDAFQEKARAMRGEPSDTMLFEDQRTLDSLRLTAMLADLKSKRSSNSSQKKKEKDEKEKSNGDIKSAWHRLQAYSSQSWINEIQSAIKQEEVLIGQDHGEWNNELYQYSSSNVKSSNDFLLTTSNNFQAAIDINLEPYNPYHALLNIAINDLTLDITAPSFTLDNTTAFVQDVGEGVPLDTEYSLLLPFRMYCSGAKTSMFIRDYPLPLLRVPEDKSARRDFRTAWTLSGDFVIADELGDVTGAWLKPMMLIPSRNYTVDLLRVASPLKFFSIVDIEVHTPEVTYIAWSMSTQPAIEDIIRIIDSFTPSPIDPSPKLGFWDKVRLMVHSRTTIRFLGQGDLALWMKGKKEPYSLSSNGAGIIKVWRGGVECRLGYSNIENELLQIFSNEYILAVPALDFDEKSSSYEAKPVNKDIFYIEEPQEHFYDQKYQKTVLSLTNGVRWGLLRFDPHYSVVYRTPKSVEKYHKGGHPYDSFEGFRSRWVHLSFTVSNTDYASDNHKTSVNALRLTPRFLGQFLDWFALFGGENGLPIRMGNLFPREDHRPTQKFGKHLSTIRYQIVLNSVFLSYIHKDEETGFEGDFLGFKASVKSFILDAHQRREKMQTDHHLLGSRSTSKWPLYEGEVIFDTMDIRGLLASYSPQTPPPSGTHFEFSSEEPDQPWIDQLDYCELEVPAIVVAPATKLLSFVTTPYFCIRKQANQAERERNAHLQGIHRCSIGNSPSTKDVQIRIHKERLDIINENIRRVEEEIADLEAKIAQNSNDTDLLGESLGLLEVMAQLYEKKRQLSQFLQDILDDEYVSPSVYSSKYFNGSSITEWEQLMGNFQKQFVLHNPCIIWNNEIRNLVYRFMDIAERSKTRSLLVSTNTLRSLINASASHITSTLEQQEVLIDPNPEDNMQIYDILESLAPINGQQNVAVSECDELYPSIESSPETVSDMNNPKWQQKSLAKDHHIQNNYTLDLLNPQILFKSTKSASRILVSAERAHVKGLDIFKSGSRDPLADNIETRSICNIENSRFFIVKSAQTNDRTSIMEDPAALNTLPWIPLEMLSDQQSIPSEFERVAHGVTATLQYDEYNKLSLEPTQHPFEENANGVRLHFPSVTLTATSAQYNVLYDVMKDLLLYSEPAKVDRQESLQGMLFISDLDTLPYVIDAAILLKNNISQHREALLQYHQYLAVLTEDQFDQYMALSKSYFELHDELYLLVESVKIAQSDKQSVMKLEAKTKLKFEVTADKVIWKMMMDTVGNMFDWDLTNLNFMWLGKEDRSVKYKLELDKLILRNQQQENPMDLIGPYFMNDRKHINFSKHKMLQGYLVESASVGGIPVVEHMELKLAPIKLNMTYDVAKSLASYLFPPEKRYQDLAENAEYEPILHDHHHGSYPNVMNMSEHNTVSPLAKNPRTLSLGKLSDFYGRVRRSEWHSTVRDDSTINTMSEDSVQLNRPRRWSAVNLWRNEISVMRKRASNTRCFIYVKIPGTKHCLTYKGPKNRNFEDLNNFVFKQPTIELRNRTCSWFELLELIKKEIMLAALLHSGSLIKEKILPRGTNRPLSWHSQRPRRWSLSRSVKSLKTSSSSEDSTIDDSEDDARSMISSFSRAEEEQGRFDSTNDLSVGSNMSASMGSRPASMFSQSSKKQKWTQRLAKRASEAPRLQKLFSRRRGKSRRASIPSSSEVMQKGKLLLGKQYHGPMNRRSTDTFDV